MVQKNGNYIVYPPKKWLRKNAERDEKPTDGCRGTFFSRTDPPDDHPRIFWLVNVAWVWYPQLSKSWLETTRKAQRLYTEVGRRWLGSLSDSDMAVQVDATLAFPMSSGSRGKPWNSDESQATTRGQQWWTCCTTPWATIPSEKAFLSGWKSVRASPRVSDSWKLGGLGKLWNQSTIKIWGYQMHKWIYLLTDDWLGDH